MCSNVLDISTPDKRVLNTATVRDLRHNERMENELPIALRLKKIRQDAGIGVREMARRIGMSVGGYRHYESPKLFKNEFLPYQLAKKIALVVAQETDAGTGSKVYELCGVYFPPDEFYEAVKERSPYGSAVPKLDRRDQDLVPIRVFPSDPDVDNDQQNQDANLALTPQYLRSIGASHPDKLAHFVVRGDAMQPTLWEDDILIVDKGQDNLNRDGLFALIFNGSVHARRIGRSAKQDHVMVISDNRDRYPPLEVALSDITPIGRVLWFGRKI